MALFVAVIGGVELLNAGHGFDVLSPSLNAEVWEAMQFTDDVLPAYRKPALGEYNLLLL